MNSKLLILSLGALVVVGCSSGESPFTQGSTSSSSNIISSNNFGITSSEINPSVLTLTAALTTTPPIPISTTCGNIATVTAPVSATITVTGADKNGGLVSTGTVFFETQYGLLDQTSCTLTKGTCSVTWSSIANLTDLYLSTGNPDCSTSSDNVSVVNEIVAWTYGAEGFVDIDGDNKLSDSELYLDTPEPFIEINGTAGFNNTVTPPDRTIDVNADGQHNVANTLFDGPASDCDTTTRTGTTGQCGVGALVPIFTSVNLRLNF